MSLHYLLDGYNILKQMPAFRDLPLEDGRQAFLKWIDIQRPHGSRNNPLTVVFDGNSAYFGSMHQGDIKVIFSDGCSADEAIKKMVEGDGDHKNCVVVSNDKEIFIYARNLGAKVMKVADFIAKAQPKSKGTAGSQQAPGDAKYIPLSRQDKINKEFSKIWLKE